LAELITEVTGSDAWVTDLPLISAIRSRVNDTSFIERFAAAKLNNKHRLRDLILRVTGGEVDVNPEALFDIHVKRIHEYKRQLMNILSVIVRYLWIKELAKNEKKLVVPRVVVFAGKAAPGYYAAKLVIKIINSVAQVINADVGLEGLLKVVFIPNYNVSVCEVIVPANDISQHISTAGTEASGTSNMKFAMNGGLILGTMDGANIEIRKEAGPDSMFDFGAHAEDVENLRARGPGSIDERLYAALHALKEGMFGEYELFRGVLDPLWHGNDYYLIGHDFESYLEAHDQIDSVWKNRGEWIRRSVKTTASMGKFSSDTSIHAYASEIWNIKPLPLPHSPLVQPKKNI
jgi:starch phosphorylase